MKTGTQRGAARRDDRRSRCHAPAPAQLAVILGLIISSVTHCFCPQTVGKNYYERLWWITHQNIFSAVSSAISCWTDALFLYTLKNVGVAAILFLLWNKKVQKRIIKIPALTHEIPSHNKLVEVHRCITRYCPDLFTCVHRLKRGLHVMEDLTGSVYKSVPVIFLF